MLTFDNSSVIVTDTNETIIQLCAMGQNSGYPAKANINAIKRLRDQLDAATREIESRMANGGSNVLDFKQHG